MADIDLVYEAQRTLKRLWPKLLALIEQSEHPRFPNERLVEIIQERLDEHWPHLFELLHRLYGANYDFFYYLEAILISAIQCWLERPDDMYVLDIQRENDPTWYQSSKMVGGSLYIDLFSDNLSKLRKRIPYLKELGLTYLHLMPCLAAREENSDGGYAVTDYRSVDPRLGTMDELKDLARELRASGISLVIDFVFNHTSDDHKWAIKAQEGDRKYQNFYYTFPDRQIPDQYEKNLREIFPTIRRGNFTWHSGIQRWVWTTFNSFQWDLNYTNPEVFRAMVAEMLYLANAGVEIMRLDAVAFVWKKMGTDCENLPEAHWLIQGLNAVCRIAAPGLVFKSEAIVHPDEVVKYIDPKECQLSYNPSLMALLWESIATRETKLLKQSLSHRHKLKPDTTWVNYLRGHDDIGWSFDDGDAWQVGINPEGHRNFLNQFYTGNFAGSFAKGVPFQFNERTGDMRISGTMASLAGLEQAVNENNALYKEMALLRIRMLYAVLCSIGGLPLIFLGEEWGLLNDYFYLSDPDKKDDSRWVHRLKMDWSILTKGRAKQYQKYINQELKKLFSLRKKLDSLAGNNMELLPVSGSSILAYRRWNESNNLLVITNFSEFVKPVDLKPLRSLGMGNFFNDLINETTVSLKEEQNLKPYQFLWLTKD